MPCRRHRSLVAVVAAFSIFYLAILPNADAQTAASPTPAASITASTGAATAIASTPTATPPPRSEGPRASAAQPSPVALQPAAVGSLTRAQIFDYLGKLIRWHAGLADQLRLAGEPEETLYVADERQTADEIVKLAVDFAHAAAALIEDRSAGSTATGALSTSETTQTESGEEANGSSVIAELQARRGQVQATVDQLKQQLADLRAQSARGAPRDRNALSREIIALQARITLAESRLDSFDAMINFESGTMATAGSASGLDAQIDELAHSAFSASATSAALPAPALPSSPANASGLLGSAENLLRVNRKQSTLAHAADATNDLRRTVLAFRATLFARLTELDRQGLSQTTRSDEQGQLALKQTKFDFEELTRRSKLLSNAILPLSKQAMLLDLYLTSLAQWRNAVRQQFNDALRSLLLRAGSLAVMLLAVFIAAAVWRRLTFRYVQDLQRRAQLLRLRRLVVITALGLIIVFGFASQLSTFATVIGLAAAGIALALQNVILSLAGYFYLSGRFGLRVGDRVQVAGVNGDVLENGFFKLTLMELSGDGSERQPTGRAVIFPNSIIFQTNANFFRQLPGTSFSWHEFSLSLGPDCDYRLAEQRLTEVANEVFARDRDRIQSEYRAMENELAIRIDTPRPQVRMRLGPAGLEIVIRYPARLKDAARTADEISRRLVDAIRREPGLRIGVVGTPIIQSDPAPSPPEQSSAPTAKGNSSLD